MEPFVGRGCPSFTKQRRWIEQSNSCRSPGKVGLNRLRAKQAAALVLLKQDLAVRREGIILGRKTFANTLKYVATLHGLWDGLPRFLFIIVTPGLVISVIPVTLSAIGLAALGLLYYQAMHQKQNEPSMLNSQPV